MQPVQPLPAVFDDYERMGGVIEFAVFEDADSDEKSAIAAITSLVTDIDQTKLLLLGSHHIDDKSFYGDWYSFDDDALLKGGTWTTRDRREFINPKLSDLEGVSITTGSYGTRKAGGGGQFAYAFSHPPYKLSAQPSKIQELFREIRDFVLPPNLAHEISDWSSPRLVEASDYFSMGMEWWGVFLWTIYIPELRRLTAIAGSTTD